MFLSVGQPGTKGEGSITRLILWLFPPLIGCTAAVEITATLRPQKRLQWSSAATLKSWKKDLFFPDASGSPWGIAWLFRLCAGNSICPIERELTMTQRVSRYSFQKDPCNFYLTLGQLPETGRRGLGFTYPLKNSTLNSAAHTILQCQYTWSHTIFPTGKSAAKGAQQWVQSRGLPEIYSSFWSVHHLYDITYTLFSM